MRDSSAGKRLAIMGSDSGLEVVAEFCRLRGISLISFGNNPNAEMHRLSDKAYIVDCTDADVMIPLLKKEKIDGVFSITSEKVIRSLAQYLPKAGIAFYTDLQQWDTLMNKAVFKQYARKFGISTPPAFALDAEKNCGIGEKDFPVIVKPADSCGSIGIRICSTAREVADALQHARTASQSGTVICEKYLTGDFFSLFAWIQNGKVYFPLVKERIFYAQADAHPKQPFLDFSPASFSDTLKNMLFPKIEKLLSSLGIKNGECWFQGFLENGTAFIIDNGFRICGERDWEVIQEESGIGLIESHIQLALTGKFGNDFSALERPFAHAYATLAVGLKNGVIGKIHGMDAAKNIPGVFSIHQYYKEGQRMEKAGLFSQSLCRVFLKAESRDALKNSVRKVLRSIRVFDENGQSMVMDYPEEYYEWIK